MLPENNDIQNPNTEESIYLQLRGSFYTFSMKGNHHCFNLVTRNLTYKSTKPSFFCHFNHNFQFVDYDWNSLDEQMEKLLLLLSIKWLVPFTFTGINIGTSNTFTAYLYLRCPNCPVKFKQASRCWPSLTAYKKSPSETFP